MVKKFLIAAAFALGSVGLTQTASAYDCYGGGYRGGYGAYRAPIAVPVYRAPAYRSGYRGGYVAPPVRSFYGPSVYGRGFGGPGFGGPGFGGPGFGSPFNYGYGGRGGIGFSIGF